PVAASTLLRTDGVLRLGGDVFDAEDLEARRLERPDRRLPARARAFDEDLDLLETVLHALAGTRVCGYLGGEGRRLAGALEPGRAGGLPRDRVPLRIGQRNDRVVERGLDMRLSDRNVLAHPAARAPLTTRRCHQVLVAAFLPRPTVFFGPLRVRAFVFVRWPWTGR